MTANTLAATYLDIQKEVAIHLGWPRDPGDWGSSGSARNVDFELIAKEGYRQFLYPEALPGENKSHNWSFLYPLGSLTLNTAYTTGTIEVSAGGSSATTVRQVEITTGTWPSWVTQGTLEYTATDEIVYHLDVITTDSADSSIIYVEGRGGIAGDPTTFVLRRKYYDLPDDYGGMVSSGFTYRRDETYRPPIKIVGEGQIREDDQESSGGIYPSVASIIPIRPVAGQLEYVYPQGSSPVLPTTESSRWKVRFHPLAIATHELEYRYYAIPPALTSGTNIYHYGGAEHSSTIIAAVLDVAFQKIRSSMEKHEAFLTRLRQSVLHDRRNYISDYVGHGVKSVGDGTYADALLDHRRATPTGNITTPW